MEFVFVDTCHCISEIILEIPLGIIVISIFN